MSFRKTSEMWVLYDGINFISPARSGFEQPSYNTDVHEARHYYEYDLEYLKSIANCYDAKVTKIIVNTEITLEK